MAKVKIREFLNSLDRNSMVPRKWKDLLREQGYYPVAAGLGSWADIHEWCNQHIGEQHYTWTGEVFWFETEQAAMLFTLRWG